MSDNFTYQVRRTSVLGPQGLAESFEAVDASGAVAFTLKYHMHLGWQEWQVLDASGSQVAGVQRHAHMHPVFTIDRPDHPQVTVRKANFMPVHETWRVEGLEDGDVDVSGSINDHEFTFTNATGAAVAQASRQWVTMHEGYGVRVTGLDPVIAICAAVGVDVIEHEHNR